MSENANNPAGSELKGRAADLARDASNELASRANTAGAKGMASLGTKIDEAADVLTDKAPERLPAERVEAVTTRMHGAASYLKENDPAGVLTDIDGAIQRHPYRAIAVAAGVGWVIGRLMSRD